MIVQGQKDSLFNLQARRRPTAASQTWANGPAGFPTSYSETSSQGGSSTDPLPPSDAPATFASWTSAPVGAATAIVGSPTLEVTLDSKAAAATQAGGPAGQLVVFAKIYDVAPDGTQTLHNRLISPTRIADVTHRVRIELTGVVQRFGRGHRIRLVLAASDAAYAGNAGVLPVTVAADKKNPAVLTLPVVSGPGPQGSAAATPTRKPKPGAGTTGGGAVLSAGALASTGAAGGTSATVALTGLLLLLAGSLLVRVARSH